MSLFVMIGWDGPEGAKLRDAHRDNHVTYISKLDAEGLLHCAGPIKNDAGNQSIGVVIIFEASDLAAARAIVDADPYVAGGVFKSVEVQPFRKVFPT